MNPTKEPVVDSLAVWSALQNLKLSWNEPAGRVFSLTPEVQLVAVALSPGSNFYLGQLYASEEFFDLINGAGDYTEEELSDSDRVMGRRYGYAEELIKGWQNEAARSLGEPFSTTGSPLYRVTWHLPHLGTSMEIHQEDKELCIEVRLILTPPDIRTIPWNY
ncbi:hypothetical protein GCM10008955_09810 [Deinococcus malanensis]|uniref:Uncharacterized protein n=1 Tax=Deinococcus malanensis TaxID=1706855 RepID=A0ABQ2ENY1_9DEIO|nr:hypothetical protein [Deinococcus malanensis]GGK18423.1 hypothetical protein GCM10008955_09810 [Deinococcus malanensis]